MNKLLSKIAVLCFLSGCAMATEEACQENEHIDEGVCQKDTLEQCGSTDNNCTWQKGWKKGICAEGKCVATDCKDGYVIKSGKCTASTPDLECEENEHVYENQCENNTLNHCGDHDNACSEIEGWGSGLCNKGECVVTECADGYELKGNKCSRETSPSDLDCPKATHPFESSCENDSLSHCGMHGNACATLEGWKDGLCLNGACFVTECQDGYVISDGKCTPNVTVPPAPECGEGTHVYEGECEEDTIDNCGTHGIICANIDGWSTGTCTHQKCVATSCKENYNLNGDTCVAVVPLECSDTQHVYEGKCEEDSVEHCGVHGTACTNMTGWLTGTCDHKMCVPTQCNSGFCIDPSTHICVNGTSGTSACGINGGACSVCAPGQKCNNGQCETPPPECTPTQHVHDGGCEDDTTENCGIHNYRCEATGTKYKCESKQCIMTGCSTGYYAHNGACKPNDDYNCGKYGNACVKGSVTNSAATACDITAGSCYATSCISKYHVYNGKCEKDDNDNCGKHGTTCTISNVPSSLVVSCDTGTCIPTKCKGDKVVSGNACVDPCGAGHYYCDKDGSCCSKPSCMGACTLPF